MKTEDLIKALSEDAALSQTLKAAVGVAALLGAAGAAMLFFAFIGVRADAAEALTTWRFSLKLALLLAAVFLMAWEFLRLLRPGTSARLWPMGVIALMLFAAVAIEMSALPVSAWQMAATGKNSLACLATIPFLSALPLGAALWAMRAGAPSSPVKAGAAAGAIAAAFGALLYGTHCTDDSPLFVALWYPLASAIVIGAGAAAGRVILRW
jgi:hypothetical protein